MILFITTAVKISNPTNIIFFTGATTLCRFWQPPGFHNLEDQRLHFVRALPGAYAPASIPLRVTGGHKPPVNDNAIVLKDPRARQGSNKTKEKVVSTPCRLLGLILDPEDG
jgi:hypothetical protein